MAILYVQQKLSSLSQTKKKYDKRMSHIADYYHKIQKFNISIHSRSGANKSAFN